MLRGETCDQCRFDARDWTAGDLAATLLALGPWWRETTRWVDPDVVAARPAPDTWSALEYAAHSRDLTGGLGRLLHAVLTVDDLVLDIDAPAGHAVDGGLAAVVDALDANAQRTAALAARTARDGWGRTAVVDGDPLDAFDVLAHAVHDATHHLMDVGRGLHLLGVPPGPRAATGSVVQVNVSPGGVPKTPVASARISKRGVEGDRQAVRRHHGRPWQALCLWSAEVIERLAAEGHPVAAGSAGENLTITGVDWTELRPGIRLRIGGALVETALWALPCKQTASSFTGGDFSRMHHERERGISRIYAWVLEDGDVAPGDPVVVEP